MKRTFLLLVSLLCGVPLVNGQTTTGEWTYTLNEADEATITAYNGVGGAVEIPETIDGYLVKTLAQDNVPIFGYDNATVASVTIPDGVTSIGDYAFWGCTGLTSVVIPDSVTTIGYFAFQDCAALENVVIGSGVTSMPYGVFSNCPSLENVEFAPGTVAIPAFALEDVTSLISVIIPDGVTRIGDSAFNGCTSLTSVMIPNSVTTIGDGAFGGCAALTIMAIPDGVITIGDFAFSGCASLTSVTIPDSVLTIGRGAFGDCSLLSALDLGTGLRNIGRTAFQDCISLENLTIPSSVTNVEAFAFRNCSVLTNVSLSSGLLRLAEQVFSGTALRDVNVPDSVLSIGADCFLSAPITNAVIPGKFLAQFGAMGLPPEVSSRLLVDALTNQFGVATTNDLVTATNNAIERVKASPNDYDLFSQAQYDANRTTGVAEGKSEVTNNPTAYNLFTESSIMDMNMGGLVLKKGTNANELDLELTIETKDSLLDNEWQVAERIARRVSMDGAQRQFLRVRAGAPYVAPDVKVLAHPTLGDILTDGTGRVLYFFTSDSPGGNPTYSGPAWPYVAVPEAPKADAGITAVLASSTFGLSGDPYLTVNGRPAYYYAGDSEVGQANGHGLGSVWWTIKVDGMINQ